MRNGRRHTTHAVDLDRIHSRQTNVPQKTFVRNRGGNLSTVLFRTRRSHPTLARVLPGSGSNVLSLWAEVGESSRGLGRIKMTTIASFISMSIILVCGLLLRNDVLTHRNFLCFRLFDTFLIPKHESVTMEHRVEFPVRSRAARSSIQLHLVECTPFSAPLCGGP